MLSLPQFKTAKTRNLSRSYGLFNQFHFRQRRKKGLSMRSLYILLFTLLSAGCLMGSGHARTKTVYRHDNGYYPSTETVVEQTYEGNTFAASVPIVLGGGYDPTGMGYGQNGIGYGGGASSLCVTNPDRCASSIAVQVPQNVVLMNGGGYGSSLQVNSGGAPQVVAAGNPGTYAPQDASQDVIDELQERLLRLEKKTVDIKPALLEQLRLQCRMFLAQPEVVKDEVLRKKLVQSCTAHVEKK